MAKKSKSKKKKKYSDLTEKEKAAHRYRNWLGEERRRLGRDLLVAIEDDPESRVRFTENEMDKYSTHKKWTQFGREIDFSVATKGLSGQVKADLENMLRNAVKKIVTKELKKIG